MSRGSSGDWKRSENLDESALTKEIALNHRHEEILAKRELLLQSRESLINSKTDQVQVTVGDWHKAKERNEQLIRELEEIYHGLQRAAHTPDDATFVGMRDSYWKMVEEEHPRWLADNKPKRPSLLKHKTKR